MNKRTPCYRACMALMGPTNAGIQARYLDAVAAHNDAIASGNSEAIVSAREEMERAEAVQFIHDRFVFVAVS